jgi:integrase/recombinase XerD
MSSFEVLKREAELQRFETSILGCFSYQDQSRIFEWLVQRSANTQILYKRIMLRFFGFFPRVTKLQDFEAAHILAFTRDEEVRIKRSSLKTYRDVLSSLFSHLAKVRHIERDITIGFIPIKVPDSFGSKTLTRAQFVRMCWLEKRFRNRFLFRLFYYSGARVSELTRITCGSFVETNRGDVFLRVIGKGNKERSILIPQFLFAGAKSLFFFEKRRWEKDQLIFMNTQQRAALSKAQIHKIIVEAAKRAGVDEKVSAHWFRHTSATNALENGAPLDVVQATLGHTSPATTQKYLHRRRKESNATYLVKKK